MKRNRSFTLLEIIITVSIIGILAAIAIPAYLGSIDKAKMTDALVSVKEIQKAEIFNKAINNTYVAADNAQEIQAKLDLYIPNQNFEYKVVDVSDDDFLVLASNIDTKEIVLAMNRDGYASIPGSSAGSGVAGPSVGGSSGGGGSSAGGSSGAGLGSGGLASGGSSGGGSTGGATGGGSSGGGSSGGGSSGGGSSGGGSGGDSGGGTSSGGGGAIVSATIEAALKCLENSTLVSYYYELIVEKEISVIFDDFSQYGTNAEAFWWGTERNTIYINQEHQSGTDVEAVAALVAHEATHADYDYYPQKWIDLTLSRHPELTLDDLNIPGNSIDQEYNAFESAVVLWNEIKDGKTDEVIDVVASAYAQGEDYMKAQIQLWYLGYDLPEY